MAKRLNKGRKSEKRRKSKERLKYMKTECKFGMLHGA
jgi:hypothetical protein